MLRKAKVYLFALLLGLSLVACEETPYYESYLPVNEAGWYADSAARFEVTIEDTLSYYLIYFNLRANNDYPKANLYLFRSIYSDGNLEYRDTANLTLADPYGRWLGDGIGELKTFQRVYRREPLRFSKAGTYTFEFVQAMREDPIIGIEDLGLTIYKQENGPETK